MSIADPIRIAVIIATKNRSTELANRSLRSLMEQTRLPDYLVVVDDSDRRYRPVNRRIVASVDLPRVAVIYLENDRTPGASGAWNVALDVLHRQVECPADVFVAILDDDDRWEPEYLEACERLAEEQSLDMIAADILRIEHIGDAPQRISAPEVLRAADFLIGNPGIQGSNLFARLSVMLAAGLFDEGLQSTTDRDLCIRLADLGSVRFSRLPRPLVEHFAEEGRTRLTARGSTSKHQGLTGFWRKYAARMTLDQQRKFCQRAYQLFNWTIDSTHTIERPSSPSASSPPSLEASVALLVGMIVDNTRPGSFLDLLRDLLRLQDDPRLAGLGVVILENGPNSNNEQILDVAAQVLRDGGASCYLVPIQRQVTDAKAGLFGEPFDRQEGRASIAQARTMLQTYVYAIAKPRTGTVVWILDGDCRLDNLSWDGSQVVHVPSQIIDALIRLRTAKVDVAIGTVTDAPPVPFVSCIRTQLVDAYHTFERLAAMRPDDLFPDHQGENMEMRTRYEDYYYDLSRRETDHLETPFWFSPQTPGSTAREALREMVQRLPQVLAGEQVFRPLILDGRLDPLLHMQPSVHRGGNAFVFDVEALRDFPNAAPTIGGKAARRSDMVWSLLNRYVARRTIVKLPLAVRQDRHDQATSQLDLETLAKDIQGYALYSALEDVLLEQLEGAHWDAGEALPGLEGIKPDHLEQRMRKYLRERLAAFSLNFHRAAGLGGLLKRYLNASELSTPWWLMDPVCADSVAALRLFVNRLSMEYDISRLSGFQRAVSALGEDDVSQFIDQLRADVNARSRADGAMPEMLSWVQHERTANAEHLLKKEYGIEGARVLGWGAEAVVLAHEGTVYKCLDYWKTRLPLRQLEFLREQVGRWVGMRGLYPLREVRMSGSWVVITYDFEPSTPYHGGHGKDLIELVQGCRLAGITCDNIHPNNLVVTKSCVMLIDYGSDIRPFTLDGYCHMARRAFLSWRFPNRADLKEIMWQALENHDLPELEGFSRFWEALQPTSKEQLLDQQVASELGNGVGRTLLDYGCGKGKLVELLAAAGWVATGYDPQSELLEAWRKRSTGINFGDRALLEDLKRAHATFDTVVCCLVLCLLEDEVFAAVLDDLACFTKRDGQLVVAICNPRFVRGTTQIQRRLTPDGVNENDQFQLEKQVFSSSASIVDVHRPMCQYIDSFTSHGFEIESVFETPGVDVETFEATSDFMIFQLRR